MLRIITIGQTTETLALKFDIGKSEARQLGKRDERKGEERQSKDCLIGEWSQEYENPS